jgi:hypothetical protein
MSPMPRLKTFEERKAIAATRGFDGHQGRVSFNRDSGVDYENEELDVTVSELKVVRPTARSDARSSSTRPLAGEASGARCGLYPMSEKEP